MTILLSKEDIQKVLTMNDTIETLEKAFSDLSDGKAIMPQRTPIQVADHSGLALFMPAYLKGLGAIGTKVVTVYKDNLPKYNLPTILGTITLLDEKTGAPLAIMDGGYLTAMRTGGAAGLATKYLSRENSKVHVLFGTGGMARTHAWAVSTVRKIEKLVLFSVDPVEKQEAFKNSLLDIIDCEIEIAESAESACRKADIITLITSSKEPVINGDWIQSGTHINGVGSHAPAMREIDTATVSKSKVICDLVDACRAEAGDFIIPVNNGHYDWNQIHGSLGDVITNKIAGRNDPGEITLFKSVGLAVQDISVALNVYERAKQFQIGTHFSF